MVAAGVSCPGPFTGQCPSTLSRSDARLLTALAFSLEMLMGAGESGGYLPLLPPS